MQELGREFVEKAQTNQVQVEVLDSDSRVLSTGRLMPGDGSCSQAFWPDDKKLLDIHLPLATSLRDSSGKTVCIRNLRRCLAENHFHFDL